MRALTGVAVAFFALVAVDGESGRWDATRELVYARTGLPYEQGGPRTDQVPDLFAIRADGTGLRRLTSTIDAELTPSWAPGGDRIAYSRGVPACSANSCRGALEADIWTLRPGSGAPRRLTRGRAQRLLDLSPTWSPDGARIAFARRGCCDATPADGIYVVRADGRGLRRLASMRALSVDWGPGGRTLAVAGDGSPPVAIDVGTGEARPLRVAGLPAATSVVDVAWAPGGGRLALATSAGLYIVRSGSARRIGASGLVAGVDWSPDGRTLAFASSPPDAPRSAHGRTTEIFLVGADGKGLRRLTTSRGFDDAPSWRPR